MSGKSRAVGSASQPLVASLTRLLALVSAMLLVVIMILTTVDVTSRYVFNAPVYGSLELTEIAMVALIMLAMPYCGATEGHIRVDVFDQLLGKKGRRLADLFTSLIGFAVLAFLVWKTCQKALDAYEYEDLTNLLFLPVWPIYAMIIFGIGGYALVIAYNIVLIIMPAGKNHD